MSTLQEPNGPVEVRITQDGIAIFPRVCFQDATDAPVSVHALSMLGAQRELTSYVIGKGYEPVSDWETGAEDDDGEPLETMRRFRLKNHSIAR